MTAVPTFSIDRMPQTRKAARLLVEWVAPAELALANLVDPFERKLDYSFKSFADATRLVPLLLPLAQRYAFFGDTTPGRRDLAVLWGNFERILRALRKIEDMLHGVVKHVDDAAAGVALGTLNGSIRQLVGMGVVLQPRVDLGVEPQLSMVDAGMPRDVADACIKVLTAHLKSRRVKLVDEVNLLFRATRDGMTAAAYHAAVAGKPRVLVVICAEGYWFGGFTRVGFPVADATGARDDDACLLTLTNPHRIPPTVYPVNLAGNLAFCVYTNRASFGPQFGAAGAIIVYAPFDTSPHHHCNGFGTGVATASYADTTGKGAATFTGKATGWKLSELLVFQV